MKQLEQVLEECLNRQLSQIIISNKRNAEAGKKVVVHAFEEKKKLLFQFAEYRNNQVFHKNMTSDEAKEYILSLLKDYYKQIEIWTADCQYTALVSKKGKATIKKRATEQKVIQLSHNRKKEYILPENEKIPFLMELGVQSKEGKIIDKKYKKFKQINRFLEFVRDVLPDLPKDRELTIIDFGCGKSYLTFSMYYYLKIMKGRQVRIIGLDLKKDVIEHCNRLAEKFGYKELTFLEGDISSYEGVNQVDMVVTLHACDTATDYALDKAVRWGASAILSVPCCQHELNNQMENEMLQPVLRYGIIKERMAALMTDALRAALLEQNGYDVQILEFIDMSHTPKNLLIRGVKRKKEKDEKDLLKQKEQYRVLCDSFHLRGTLEELLNE